MKYDRPIIWKYWILECSNKFAIKDDPIEIKNTAITPTRLRLSFAKKVNGIVNRVAGWMVTAIKFKRK